jgi:hypothetical protein
VLETDGSERDAAFEGTLAVEEYHPNFVNVYFVPSKNTDGGLFDLKPKAEPKIPLVDFHGGYDYLEMFPFDARRWNKNFLKQKYSSVKSIVLEGFGFTTPTTIGEVLEELDQLPKGFVKDYRFGLGLLHENRWIINAIEEIDGVESLTIPKIQSTKIEQRQYVLAYEDYDSIRRGLNRITQNARSWAVIEKDFFAFNSLLNRINPNRFPERKRPYKKDTVYKVIRSSEDELSNADKDATLATVRRNVRSIAQRNRADLLQLKSDIELVTLDQLILRFEQMLGRNLRESQWQTFFGQNSFVLTLAFGFPIVKIGESVSVGGRKLEGSGDKITDYLFKSALTYNAALIEIKTPTTELLSKREYRGAVYGPSSDLAGAINQVLDQRYQLSKQLAILKDNSGIRDLESYAVKALLIIGMTPTERERKKALDLFRYNSKDVDIVTYDELLEKLKALQSFLRDPA